MRITGVGSLPHTDAAAAARFVLATTDVPYLPQLPARHPEEAMLRQWGDGVCGLGAVADGIGLRHGAPPGPRREAFGGAAALLEAGPAPLLKTQVTGPVTLALAALAAGHGRAGLWACLLPALTERVAAHLAWIRRRRPEAGVVVLVDEPGLVAFAPGAPPGPIAPEEAAEALGTFLATIDAPAGIHCCGETDWRLVARLRPDWISWDLERLGAAFAPAADALAAATAAGTRFVWGVVPTRPGVPPTRTCSGNGSAPRSPGSSSPAPPPRPSSPAPGSPRRAVSPDSPSPAPSSSWVGSPGTELEFAL